MMLVLIACIAFAGDPKADPDMFPLALHRSMEIDDMDREIQRLHDTVLLKKAQYAASQRLATKGLVSRGDLEREGAEVRYQEAREAESIAFRALKSYERDVLGQVIAADEAKAYSLLLDWIRKQIAIAQVDVDYKGYLFKQTKALFGRNAVSRQELEDAELTYNTAQASAALSRSREAQVLMELGARRGEKPYDGAEYHRLKGVYLKARVKYYEINTEGSRRRLDIARERSRMGLIPTSELNLFEKAVSEADAALGNERRALQRHEAELPASAPNRQASRETLRGSIG